MKYYSITALVYLLCILGWGTNTIASEPFSIFVSIVPQKYFVEKIGGDLADVSVMVNPGSSPATYEPKPRQMTGLSKARIYYAIGVPFENIWLKKIGDANPDMLMVHTEDGIEKISMKAYQHYEGEDHNDKGETDEEKHHHGSTDPHIWLSPPLVRMQADNILRALLTIDPDHGAIYEGNHKKFVREIDELDAEIRTTFSEKGERLQFMVFHPSWGYFAHAYGLEQIPVEIEGKSPKPSELQQFIRHAKKQGIKMIFVQPQFSKANAQVIARAIGGQIAFADPLAPDWADNLRRVSEKFKAAFKEK